MRVLRLRDAKHDLEVHIAKCDGEKAQKAIAAGGKLQEVCTNSQAGLRQLPVVKVETTRTCVHVHYIRGNCIVPTRYMLNAAGRAVVLVNDTARIGLVGTVVWRAPKGRRSLAYTRSDAFKTMRAASDAARRGKAKRKQECGKIAGWRWGLGER